MILGGVVNARDPSPARECKCATAIFYASSGDSNEPAAQTMFQRNRLLVRIPFLMEAAAESALAVVLLFSLVLMTAAILVLSQ